MSWGAVPLHPPISAQSRTQKEHARADSHEITARYDCSAEVKKKQMSGLVDAQREPPYK